MSLILSAPRASKSSGLSTRVEAGIAVGVIVAVFAAVEAGFWYWRRKRRSVSTTAFYQSPTSERYQADTETSLQGDFNHEVGTKEQNDSKYETGEKDTRAELESPLAELEGKEQRRSNVPAAREPFELEPPPC